MGLHQVPVTDVAGVVQGKSEAAVGVGGAKA